MKKLKILLLFSQLAVALEKRKLMDTSQSVVGDENVGVTGVHVVRAYKNIEGFQPPDADDYVSEIYTV